MLLGFPGQDGAKRLNSAYMYILVTLYGWICAHVVVVVVLPLPLPSHTGQYFLSCYNEYLSFSVTLPIMVVAAHRVAMDTKCLVQTYMAPPYSGYLPQPHLRIHCIIDKFNFLWFFSFTPGPAPEANTNDIFSRTQTIKSYKICHEITVDLDTIGSQSWEVEGRTFTVTIRDSVEDYTQLMKEIFDFDLLKKLISGTEGQAPFKFVASAMHGGGFNNIVQLLY